MSLVSPSQSAAGETIDAADINTPINQIAAVVNGNLDDNNIASVSGTKITDATIANGKLTNDTITGAKINFAATGADAGIWWEELGRTTLSSSGDTITVSSIPARKYLKLIYCHIATGGTTTALLTFNGDTATNYATRASSDQGATATATSGTSIAIQASAFQTDLLAVIDVLNIQAQSKLVNIKANIGAGQAATVAPGSRDVYGKWANGSAQISSITITNTGAGSFDTGSELVVLGHN